MILEHDKGLLLMRHDSLGERNWRSDECYKLIFSPYGKGLYQTGQRDISINAGNSLILNPGQEHKQLHVTEEKFLVEVEHSLLREVAEQLGFKLTDPEFALLPSVNPQIVNWISFIRKYITVSSNVLFIENSLTQLAILMLQNSPGSHSNDLPVVSGELENVTNALKESYDENWTLAEMAEQAEINKYQFAHMFKNQTGLSPYSWLQLYRLIKSQQLLIQTGESILTIALKVGFKNISSYNNLFKKVYGRTPTEFRMFYRNKK